MAEQWKPIYNFETVYEVSECGSVRSLSRYVRCTVGVKDGDKANNASSNLEWATRTENQRHARFTGLWKPRKGYRRPDACGELNWNAKLTNQDVADIRRRLYLGESTRVIATDYNVHISTVQRIRKRVTRVVG